MLVHYNPANKKALKVTHLLGGTESAMQESQGRSPLQAGYARKLGDPYIKDEALYLPADILAALLLPVQARFADGSLESTTYVTTRRKSLCKDGTPRT